ncbi:MULTISPECIES: copper-binding protein [Myxococcaceae]|uniref:copper-binding protein n=1 Tax=Myxococcaceae TaxID=31 RepID=UPI00188E04CA|nr:MULTISPECIES: copper-binding protein [Myxococcaceae]MBF5044066.1 copper-binding protein [Simulacricoccus sp. 17bor-14]
MAGQALAAETAGAVASDATSDFTSEVRELSSVEGQISRVDLAQGTVTLQRAEGELVMRVDAGTTIFLAGRTGELKELSAGQRVRAAYEQAPDGRGAVAQWIELAVVDGVRGRAN